MAGLLKGRSSELPLESQNRRLTPDLGPFFFCYSAAGMYKLTLIFLGGGCGSLLRYVIAGFVQPARGGGALAVFPVGTMTVNAVGCLLIGILAALFVRPVLVSEEVRLALLIGVLGGFTTFSTFAYETFELVNDGEWGRAAFNVALTNAVCLTAAWAGYRAAEWVAGA